MKTLSVQQPWATLICCGIKDVENRTWEPPQVPFKVLIHTGVKKVSRNFQSQIMPEWDSEIHNAMFFGAIPPLEMLPTSAIIGYVDVVAIRKRTDSIWDGGSTVLKWMLKNPFLFDEPIPDVHGKLKLFDYPLDENQLPPAHKVEVSYPKLNGTELVFPISPYFLPELKAGQKELSLAFTPKIAEIFDRMVIQEGRYPAKTILFQDGTESVRFSLEKVAIEAMLEESGEIFEYKDLKGHKRIVEALFFLLGSQLY